MTDRVIQWDWKDQAPLEKIAQAVRDMSQGACDLREVPDTGGDCYAVVVADHRLTGEQAQTAYDTEVELLDD